MTGRTHGELEPGRLLDDGATPAALRAALSALRERAPSDAAAARIRERIQSPPRPRGRPITGSSVVLLGLLGWLAWSVWPERTAHAPAPRPPTQAQPTAAGGAPSSASSPAPAARSRPPSRPPSPPMAPAAETPAAARAAAPTEPPPVALDAPVPLAAPAAPRSVRRTQVAPRAPTAAPESEHARSLERAPRRAEEPAPAGTDLQPLPRPAAVDDAERMFADPQDEAGLLYRAKRLSSSEPSAALRLLVLHEASFPAGAFAQERDMLEIQIHERLGHTATVKRLAAIFRQRYPQSVYRVSP